MGLLERIRSFNPRLVVQAQGWRAGFLTPAAVAALGGLGVFLFASENGAKAEGRRLDGIGTLTCAVGLPGLVFGIIRSTTSACCTRGCCNPSPLGSVTLGKG